MRGTDVNWKQFYQVKLHAVCFWLMFTNHVSTDDGLWTDNTHIMDRLQWQTRTGSDHLLNILVKKLHFIIILGLFFYILSIEQCHSYYISIIIIINYILFNLRPPYMTLFFWEISFLGFWCQCCIKIVSDVLFICCNFVIFMFF